MLNYFKTNRNLKMPTKSSIFSINWENITERVTWGHVIASQFIAHVTARIFTVDQIVPQIISTAVGYLLLLLSTFTTHEAEGRRIGQWTRSLNVYQLKNYLRGVNSFKDKN